MLNLRAIMVGIQTLLFPENPITGELVRMKTGLRLTQLIENRLGIMGPDFINPISITDYNLEREGKILDKLPPQQLDQLSAELARLAQRIPLERGDPETWGGWRRHQERRGPYCTPSFVGMAQVQIHCAYQYE
jgi:hypothetical protein